MLYVIIVPNLFKPNRLISENITKDLLSFNGCHTELRRIPIFYTFGQLLVLPRSELLVLCYLP